MRLAVDIDGVLCNFREGLRTLLLARGWPVSALVDSGEWDFYTSWQLPQSSFVRLLDEGEVFSLGPPIHRAATALRMLRKAGHGVHLVTARPAHLEALTVAWLGEHRFEVDSLTFSADKTAVDADVYVDDKPANIDALRAAGRQAVVFDQTWNRQVDGPRMFGWDEANVLLGVPCGT